jgi:hypothetical protein
MNEALSSFEETSDLSEGLDSSFWDQGIDSTSSIPPLEQYTIEHSISGAETPNWTREKTASLKTVSCSTINESAGGYCIGWKGKNIPKIKIGELIGIRHASKKDRYTLAVTRWMKDEKKMMLLGVAIIAPGCRTVEAKQVDTDINTIVRQCLLLPGKKGETPASIIIPPLAFREGHKVAVSTDTGEIKIQLTELIEGSGAFNRYGFTELSQARGGKRLEDDHYDSVLPEQTKKIKPTKESGFDKDDDSGFDTIWSVL